MFVPWSYISHIALVFLWLFFLAFPCLFLMYFSSLSFLFIFLYCLFQLYVVQHASDKALLKHIIYSPEEEGRQEKKKNWMPLSFSFLLLFCPLFAYVRRDSTPYIARSLTQGYAVLITCPSSSLVRMHAPIGMVRGKRQEEKERDKRERPIRRNRGQSTCPAHIPFSLWGACSCCFSYSIRATP